MINNKGRLPCLRVLACAGLIALFAGCASTPQEKEAKRQQTYEREAQRERERVERKAKEWQAKLSVFSTDQLRYRWAALDTEASKGYWGQGFAFFIAKGRHDSIVEERDAIGMEIVRREGRQMPPGARPGGEMKPTVSYMTGFLISADGHLLTCAHGLSEGCVAVVLRDGVETPARILRLDPANDLALMKAEGTFSFLTVRQAAELELGEEVNVIGFPNPRLQGLAPKLTRGNVNSLYGIRDDVRHFQLDAAVQPGSSGSPVIDRNGSVVGMITSSLSDLVVLAESGALPQNVNYAVKSDYFSPLLSSVKGLRQQSKQKSNLQTAAEAVVLIQITTAQ